MPDTRSKDKKSDKVTMADDRDEIESRLTAGTGTIPRSKIPVVHSPVRKFAGMSDAITIASQDTRVPLIDSAVGSMSDTNATTNAESRLKSVESRIGGLESLMRQLVELQMKERSIEGTNDGRDIDDRAEMLDIPSERVARKDRSGDDAQNAVAFPSGVKLPRGGWLKDPFEELAFSGWSDAQNPLAFVKRFRNIAEYEHIADRDQIYYFGKCLCKEARIWWGLNDFRDIESAIEEFSNYFWGDEQQSRFREKLYTGNYEKRRGRMSEYALRLTRHAKHLSPPMTDAEIIRCVKRQFGTRVSREIRTGLVRTIPDFIQILNELESEMTYEKRDRRENDIYSRKPDRETKNFGKNYKDSSDTYRAKSRSSFYGGRAEKEKESVNKDRSETKNREYEKRDYDRRDKHESDSGTSVAKNDGDNAKKEKSERKGDRRKTAGGERNVRFRKLDTIETDVSDENNPETLPDDGEGDRDVDEALNIDSGESKRDAGGKVFGPKVTLLRTRKLLDDADEACEVPIFVDAITEPEIEIVIADRTVKALIDTGAQISAVEARLHRELAERDKEIRTIPIRQFNLRGAFGDKSIPVAYKTQLEIGYMNRTITHEFYVVKGLTCNMVIGIDLLAKHGARLSFETSNLDVRFGNPESRDVRPVMNSIEVLDPREQLRALLDAHAEVFSPELGRVAHYEHKIQVNTNKPYKSKTYPIPDIHFKKVERYIDELIEIGVIEKAATPFINPLVVVIKKNKEIRLCLDARELNKRTVNDHEQPPTIDEIFRRIGTRKIFSTLDVNSAFWQIPLEAGSRKYTGFIFNNQSFVFKRMPFGLKTAGASFTRAMHLALGSNMLDFLLIYLDDILIASDTLEEHIRHIDYVLDKLREAGFTLNRDKCVFIKNEIEFLGHTFNDIRASINSDTRDAITQFREPRDVKSVQSFLGLANWDRRFIKNLSNFTRPLEILLQKGQKFTWGEEQKSAFEGIKEAFRQAPDLFLIKENLNFGLDVDASKIGLGAHLYQMDQTERRYTIAYASRSLKSAEKNYTMTELECLALVWALRKWYHLLMGRKIKVNTDHKALKFISTCTRNSERIARWFSFLQEFDLEINHIPGASNKTADTLSRMRIEGKGDTNAEPKIRFVIRPDDGADSSQWIATIIEAQNSSDRLMRKIEENQRKWYIRDGIVRYNNRETERIPIPESHAWLLIRKIHEYLLHFGTDKVIACYKNYFITPNTDKIVRDVVASCHVCMATKYYTRPTVGNQYYDLPTEPNKIVSIDIFGPLPTTGRGYKYVLVTMDQFTKFVQLMPMFNQKLDTIIETMERDYRDLDNPPEQILSDKGGQFITNRWAEFGESRGISIRHTSPYNPQSNPVERVMREIGRIIRVYAHSNQHRWDRIIERANFIINNTVHASTGFCPSELTNVDYRELPIDDKIKPNLTRRQRQRDPQDELRQKREDARRQLDSQAAKRKTQAQKREIANAYDPGSLVWIKLHRRSDRSRRLTRKIHLVYDGPYRIREMIKENVYFIENLDGSPIGAYNTRQLRPHREPECNYSERNSSEEGDNPEGNNEEEIQIPNDSTQPDDNDENTIDQNRPTTSTDDRIVRVRMLRIEKNYESKSEKKFVAKMRGKTTQRIKNNPDQKGAIKSIDKDEINNQTEDETARKKIAKIEEISDTESTGNRVGQYEEFVVINGQTYVYNSKTDKIHGYKFASIIEEQSQKEANQKEKWIPNGEPETESEVVKNKNRINEKLTWSNPEESRNEKGKTDPKGKPEKEKEISTSSKMRQSIDKNSFLSELKLVSNQKQKGAKNVIDNKEMKNEIILLSTNNVKTPSNKLKYKQQYNNNKDNESTICDSDGSTVVIDNEDADNHKLERSYERLCIIRERPCVIDIRTGRKREIATDIPTTTSTTTTTIGRKTNTTASRCARVTARKSVTSELDKSEHRVIIKKMEVPCNKEVNKGKDAYALLEKMRQDEKQLKEKAERLIRINRKLTSKITRKHKRICQYRHIIQSMPENYIEENDDSNTSDESRETNLRKITEDYMTTKDPNGFENQKFSVKYNEKEYDIEVNIAWKLKNTQCNYNKLDEPIEINIKLEPPETKYEIFAQGATEINGIEVRPYSSTSRSTEFSEITEHVTEQEVVTEEIMRPETPIGKTLPVITSDRKLTKAKVVLKRKEIDEEYSRHLTECENRKRTTTKISYVEEPDESDDENIMRWKGPARNKRQKIRQKKARTYSNDDIKERSPLLSVSRDSREGGMRPRLGALVNENANATCTLCPKELDDTQKENQDVNAAERERKDKSEETLGNEMENSHKTARQSDY